MRKIRKNLSALVLAVCLLMSIALGSVALAANDSFVPAEGNGGTGSLTVKPAGEAVDAAYVSDLLSANVVVDVYKMADATKDERYLTYAYTLEGAYAPLQSQLDACIAGGEGIDSATNAEDWKAFAQAAAEAAGDAETPTATIGADGAKVSGLAQGLYLVLPHGAGLTRTAASDPLIAQSDTYEYTFDPIVIAIPSKEDVNGDGIIMTSVEDGDWSDDATIVLKSSRERRYGSVAITKTFSQGTDGKKATFVFHITEVAPASAETETAGKNRPYDEYVSVYLAEDGSATTALATKIPAGITVRITEVDAGPRYNVSGAEYTEVIKADDATAANAGVQVSFDNTPNGNNIDGYGIENKFEHDDETWNWQRVPAADSATTSE